jgi:D-sedoheptulose 7-phosphate isomerase
MKDMSQSIVQTLHASLAVRQATLRELSEQITTAGLWIIETLHSGGRLYIFGNGGSGAIAQHFAGELLGHFSAPNRIPLPALALSADATVLTGIANDYGYAEIFARQVKALVKPEDIAIGMSTSGASENILRGLESARANNAKTIALTGQYGLARPVADMIVAISSNDTALIQEEHLAIVHAWCKTIELVKIPNQDTSMAMKF